jgi:cysteine-rich repeat protein
MVNVTATWGGYGGYLFLYDVPFDPAQPLLNCILGGADVFDTHSSEVFGIIEAGESLAIVATSYWSSATFTYTLTVATLKVTCGDGLVTGGEICDDSNASGGDGCSAACDAVEEGYVCDTEFSICTALDPALVINEIDYDMTSTDSAEFVEIYNGTGAEVSLAGLAYVGINGGASGDGAEVANSRIALDATGFTTLPAGGYLVIGASAIQSSIPAGSLFIPFAGATDNIQNGAPGAVALIDTVAKTVIDSLSYEGEITAATITGFAGPVSLVDGAATTLKDEGTAISGSMCRRGPNGRETHNDSLDWSLCSTPTPGAANQ